ncbi:MAG: hypothetical protein AAF549_04445 [Pseudomonadota bacterium]
MKIFILLFPLLILSGCVSQQQADNKMTEGCRAGITSYLQDQGKEIKEVIATRYSTEENPEGNHRRITFDIIEKDGWLELEQEYSCLFHQQWNAIKTQHYAMLSQVKAGDETLGKDKGVIYGDMQTFIRIVSAADAVMGQ